MLNDEQRAAYELAVERLRESAINTTGPVDHWKTMFAAGIAYAQTQQAAMIAQARAEEREACAKVADEVAERIKYESNRSPEHHVRMYAAAIRARKDA